MPLDTRPTPLYNDPMTDEPIVPLLRSSADDLLTLKDLSERLGVTYGRLRGFAEVPGVAAYVGAVAVPGVKGVRYLPEAEAQFRRLIAAQNQGLVTPRTAKAHLERLLDAPGAIAERGQLSNAEGAEAVAVLQQSSARDLAAILDRLVSAQERAGAAPDDRLVGREEAAGMLACSPRSVGRYVRPVRAGVWRRSDLRGYIAGLAQL